jgi:hypothetical protein
MMTRIIKVTITGTYEADELNYDGLDPIEVDSKALKDGNLGYDDLLSSLDTTVKATFTYWQNRATDMPHEMLLEQRIRRAVLRHAHPSRVGFVLNGEWVNELIDKIMNEL